MEKLDILDGPVGWLIDPHNKWAIHFDFKMKSDDKKVTDFTIDMWGIAPNGKPMEFKSRRKATQLDSIKTWNQLVASDWVQIDLEKIKTA